MVEVPEHLLKRSKERRAALGLGGGEASSSGEAGGGESPTPAAAPAAATPAPAKPAPPPAPKPPERPKPDPLYIQAAKQRQRLPWWSIPVFASIPLWAWAFVGTLSPAEEEVDPLAAGEAAYGNNCASCHGGSGEGATAPALTEVAETWPDFRDHMMWVRTGAGDWPSDTYGAQDTAHTGVMPSYSGWTDQEIAQVVLYERQVLGEVDTASGEVIGTDPNGEEITEEQLLLIAEGELTFADVGLGTESEEQGFTEADLGG